MNILADELVKRYESIEPMDFYREIFPLGELDSWTDKKEKTKGKYTAIALEVENGKIYNGKQSVKRYTVTDDLDEIDGLLSSKNFCLIAPISYVGKARKSENARIMYALCVELDDLIIKNGEQDGLHRLEQQWTERVGWIPKPTYTVASGTGLHLYYLFDKPIPLFPNIVKSMMNYKRQLTIKLWNRHVTTSTGDKIQQESIFQGFRMVGTITKKGDRVQAFRTGEPVTIEYMNCFTDEKNQIDIAYKSNLTKAQAKEKYPEWYEKRIVEKKPKGHWICKRDLYDWWKRRIETEAVVGHRYYCLMMLAIYAVKCDISQEELEKDCLEMMNIFEAKTDSETNHFTEKDVMDALQSFEDKTLITYPVTSVSNRSGLHIEKNKRNGRKQSLHIEFMNVNRKFKVMNGECTNGGRPIGTNKQQIVYEWQLKNPNGRKCDCIKDTGLAKPTVYKWWGKEMAKKEVESSATERLQAYYDYILKKR